MKIESFNTLYITFYQRAIQFVKSYIHDSMEAEDIVSEVMISFWKKTREEGMPKSPEGLLITMLRNKSLDVLKHQLVKMRMMNDIEEWEHHELEFRVNTLQACDPMQIYTEEISLIIKQTMEQLPEKTQQIYQMSRNEYCSYAEIARRMKMSEKSIEYHMSKALRVFREALGDFLTLLF